MSLENQTKTALVTGSTKGMGKAIAVALLEKGYYVFLNYANNEEEARLVTEELSEQYKDCFSIVKADLSQPLGIDALISYVLDRTDGLDCLVLNAGATARTPLKDMSLEEWNFVMNVNLNMPFYLIQKLYDHIHDNGRIVFIGSSMGIHPHAMSLPYSVSKAGVNFFAKALVKEFADRKITVNTIAPGFIDTPWQLKKPADIRKRIEDKVALHRFGLPEEVAKLCMHIIDNEYINGSVLEIDGGYCYR